MVIVCASALALESAAAAPYSSTEVGVDRSLFISLGLPMLDSLLYREDWKLVECRWSDCACACACGCDCTYFVGEPLDVCMCVCGYVYVCNCVLRMHLWLGECSCICVI